MGKNKLIGKFGKSSISVFFLASLVLAGISLTLGAHSLQAQTAYTIWSNSATPAILSDSDTSPVELGLKFRADTAGYVTGIRFYKAAANTGTHVGNLWSATGALLASVTFTNETASGWQQMALSTPRSHHSQHDLCGLLSHQCRAVFSQFILLCYVGCRQWSVACFGGRGGRPQRRLPLRQQQRFPQSDLAVSQLLGGCGLLSDDRAGHDASHSEFGFPRRRFFRHLYRYQHYGHFQ